MARFTGAAGAGGLLLGLMVGLCAGGGGEAAPVDAAGRCHDLPPIVVDDGSTTTTSSADVTDTTQAALDRNPLTGEPLAQATSRRIVAVKVDNVLAAQPQIGIGEAEMIIEAPVEGGITRFTALFYDATPSTVGPGPVGAAGRRRLACAFPARLDGNRRTATSCSGCSRRQTSR